MIGNVSASSFEIGAYPLIIIAMLVLYAVIHDRITSYNDLEQLRDGHVVPSIDRSGAYVGLGVAMIGSLVMSRSPFEDNVQMFATDGVVAVVVFIIAHFVMDFFVLRGINNADQVGAGNRAVAKLESCGYVALGLIIGASFSGDGDGSVLSGLANAALFSGIGLATLMIIYVAYDAAWRMTYKFWIDNEVGNGNEAAALDAGSLMLSMGVVLFFSIAGDHEGSLLRDVQSYAETGFVGIVILVVVRLVLVLLLAFLCKVERCKRAGVDGGHHGNQAKSLVIAGASLVSSMSIGTAIFFA